MSTYSGFPGYFNAQQTLQLLAPIREHRVLRDGKGNSHVSQQDVTAHLIRVFGFGNFMTEVLHHECIFETPKDPENRGSGSRWDVCYRAHVRLTIFDDHHEMVTSFEDVSCGDAQNQSRQDAHDLALKSAVSLAKKRCAINLGDQFGLSLYNKGQLEALVRGTIVLPPKPEGEEPEKQKDLQEGVPQQVSLGTDEIEKSGEEPATEPTEEQTKMLQDSLGATKVTDEAAESQNDTAKADEEQAGMPSQQEGS